MRTLIIIFILILIVQTPPVKKQFDRIFTGIQTHFDKALQYDAKTERKPVQAPAKPDYVKKEEPPLPPASLSGGAFNDVSREFKSNPFGKY